MSVISSVRDTSRAERTLVVARLFARMAFDSCYFVGIIGCATYVLGADAFGVAAIVLVLNIALAVGNSTAGVVIDRVGPRRTLLVTLCVLVVAGLAIQAFEPTLVVLVVVSGIFGLLDGFMDTAFSSYPPFLVVGREALKRTNALLGTATNLSIIIGPAVGALIVANAPILRVFLFMAAADGVAAAVILRCREQVNPREHAAEDGDELGEVDGREGNPRFWGDLADGWRTTFASRELRLLFVVGFLGFFAFGAFDSLESLFYRDVLKVGVEWMGWLSTIMGVGCVLGSVAMLRTPSRRVGMTLLLATLLVVGVGSMLYVGTDILVLAAVGQLVTGFGFGFMSPLQNVLVQESCDLSYLGRVMGVMRMGLQSAGILPLLVAPFLAEAVGVQAVLFGASTFVALVAAAFLAPRVVRARRARG